MVIMTVREAAGKWSISERWVQKLWVQKLCEENRVKGAVRFSRIWMIPKAAAKLVDGRSWEKTNE